MLEGLLFVFFGKLFLDSMRVTPKLTNRTTRIEEITRKQAQDNVIKIQGHAKGARVGKYHHGGEREREGMKEKIATAERKETVKEK